MKAFLIFFTLLGALKVNAQFHPLENDEFRNLISSYQAQCPSLACSSISIHLKTLNLSEIQKLDSETRNILDMIVYEMSQIWGDTILEGEYYSDAPSKLDQIQTIHQGAQLLGYRITYSAPAWKTSNCHFDSGDLRTLAQCQPGRITESTFVSADFTEFFQDRYTPATFIP